MSESVKVAPNGVFFSLQGEGHLRGFQMSFLRLAGCSVGCPGCDTNYSVAERLSTPEILGRLRAVRPEGDRDQWVWITGGEPTDHDLLPLLRALKSEGYSTAVATSGVRRLIPPVDWISLSPHSHRPGEFHQRYASELKLVDGLNGLDLESWEAEWGTRVDAYYRYVQPLTVAGKEDPESLARCLAFLRKRPKWALSRQDHVAWGVA